MTALVVALTAVVALLSLLVVGLLRSHAEILRRLHELGAGLDPDPEGTSPRTRRPRPVQRVPRGPRTRRS